EIDAADDVVRHPLPWAEGHDILAEHQDADRADREHDRDPDRNEPALRAKLVHHAGARRVRAILANLRAARIAAKQPVEGHFYFGFWIADLGLNAVSAKRLCVD